MWYNEHDEEYETYLESYCGMPLSCYEDDEDDEDEAFNPNPENE